MCKRVSGLSTWVSRLPWRAATNRCQTRQFRRYAPVTHPPHPCCLSWPADGSWMRCSPVCAHDPMPAHTIAAPYPSCLLASVSGLPKDPTSRDTGCGGDAGITCGGAGRPGVFPSRHHRHQPPLTLLETTVISINKQVHPCILCLCESERVLAQAVRPKRELPRCARG